MGQALMSFNVAAIPVSMGWMVASFNTPPTTVGTAVVLYGLGVSGFILLGAKLGQRFNLEAVQSLTSIACSCEEMVARGLVRPEGQGYMFNHALIHEAVYASLLRSRRHELHLRAAAWFAARDPVLHAQHLDAASNSGAAIDAARRTRTRKVA